MQILINKNQEITAYAIEGGLVNGVGHVGDIPDDFEDNFKPSFYLLQNNEIVLNPDYVEPTPPKPNTGPTTEQVMINQLGLKYADLSAKVGKLEGSGSNG
ncbi:Putative prophage protein [Latilactobacillus curvatus]|uniref:DUF2977 domain-containing protein n=1 Tax=Latilactobacillus curvatus TaxID=28038 RepID=UPI000A1ADCCB|nr:DUF2977 domain-containing protein [Latilactobacillus curvatus]SMH68992.1 Putative prophage protein [Latilactobacillus curvatus]